MTSAQQTATGRDVTIGDTVTGTVLATWQRPGIFGPTTDTLHRIVDADGREHIVECATLTDTVVVETLTIRPTVHLLDPELVTACESTGPNEAPRVSTRPADVTCSLCQQIAGIDR